MTKGASIQSPSIDGMRALAALYVLAEHTIMFAGFTFAGARFFYFGHQVVAAFLAISGFCLTLPLASRDKWSVATADFYRRRARRILPPYYAALLMAALVLIAEIHVGGDNGLRPGLSLPGLFWHLSLLHNWSLHHSLTINGPLWSIAVECQIYLLFPAFVWIWRRKAGPVFALFLSAILSVALMRAFPGRSGLEDFPLIFVEGMIGAYAAFDPFLRKFIAPALVASLAALVLSVHHPARLEMLAGIVTTSLLAFVVDRPSHPLSAALGWKPLAWVGTFSYSIYLFHGISLPAMLWWLTRPGLPPISAHRLFWVLALVGCPLSLVLSFGFHVVFERPFMSSRRQMEEKRLAKVAVAG